MAKISRLRRIRAWQGALIVPLLAAYAGSRAEARPGGFSNWDDGTRQGWDFQSEVPGATIHVVASGGVGGGAYVQYVDTDCCVVGPVMVAPSGFAGNYLPFEGIASFEWYERCEQAEVQAANSVQIVLAGPGGRASQHAVPGPPHEWTPRRVVVGRAPELGWVLHSGSWDALLANVTSVGLGVDLVAGVPVSGLDGAIDSFSLAVCTADVNRDGTVNSSDFFSFLSAFFAGETGMDLSGDGVVDSEDFFAFLGAFFAGC